MLNLSPLFSPHCVLPMGREIRIFGETDAPEVTVRLMGYGGGSPLGEVCCEAVQGRFEALLPPQWPQTGCTLAVTAGEDTVLVPDVAVGLVLLCGGQSNMELELQNCAEGPELLERHNDWELRYFNVPKYARGCPEADAAWAASRWVAVAPGTGRDMSAVAYFAACRVREAKGLPVGVVDCYWGGTSVTCWMDEDTLLETAEGARYLRDYETACAGKDMDTYLREEAAFQAEMDVWNGRVAAARSRLGADAPWAAIEAEAGVCPWHPPVGPGSPFRPAGLFSTMVRRILPLSVSAALWYQGEDDTTRTSRYDLLLSSLMRCWRWSFKTPALPFVVAQLPMWQPDNCPEDDLHWPRLRLQQAQVCDADAHALCVCQLDQGEQHNIHPVHKRPIGRRMGDALLSLLMGEHTPASPRAVGMRDEGAALEVTVTEELRDVLQPKYFELRGVDGSWRPAEARISGRTILLTAADLPHPVAARYGHVSWGEVNVFGMNGLPLAPFVLE